MTTIKETRREHGLRACGRSGRGLGPFLPRPAQTCHGPSAGRIPPPCSAGCASPLPSSLPPSRPAVPGCDHRGPTLTAVFLRPPLLMGRRDERSQARAKPSRWPSGSRGFFFLSFFFSCQGSVWEKEQWSNAGRQHLRRFLPGVPGRRSFLPSFSRWQGRSH